jgi:hypothetical protein
MGDTFDRFVPRERGRFGDNERAPSRPRVTGASDLVDLTLNLMHEKAMAIAVTDPAKPGGKWIWLPRSQCEFERKGSIVAVVTMPQWLARDKGLV